MTRNHGYNAPEEGTTDWHIPLNENFKSLDSDVEIRDKRTNLSNYSPKQGAKFHATDTGEIFFGDGSSWNFHGSISSGSLGVYATSRSASEFNGPTDGILAAMNDLPSGQPGMVMIPSGAGSGPNGEYVVSNTSPGLPSTYPDVTVDAGVLVDRDNTWFVSDGATVTVDPNSECHVFFVTAGVNDNTEDVPGTQVTNVYVEGFYFDGKGRSGINFSTYESRNVYYRNNVTTGFAPSGNFFDTIPVRSQHISDNFFVENNIFACNQANYGWLKLDGTRGGRVADNYFYTPESASANPTRYAQQNINNDVDRTPYGVLWENNYFDYKHGSNSSNLNSYPLVDWQQGRGGTIRNNIFELLPGDFKKGRLKIRRPSGDYEDNADGGTVVAENEFYNTGIDTGSTLTPDEYRGMTFKDNRFYNTAGNQFYYGILIGQKFVDSEFIGNIYMNVGDIETGSDNQGTLFDVIADASPSAGNTFRRNKAINAADWMTGQSNLTLSDQFFANNESVYDPPSNSTAVKQRNKGSALASDSDAIAHGLDMTPSIQDITLLKTETSNRVYPTSVDGTFITIGLEDPSGSAVTTGETIYWAVDATPSWAI